MRRWLCLSLVVALCACGAPSSESVSTPRERFDELRGAITESDWDKVYDLTAPSERAACERHWEKERETSGRDLEALAQVLDDDDIRDMPYRRVFPLLMDHLLRQEDTELRHLRDATCEDEEVEGVRCRLSCRWGEREKHLILRREDGHWFVSGLIARVQRTACTARR